MKLLFEPLKVFLILATTLLVQTEICAQTFYYVNGSSGSDTNSGTSPAQPWKTIQKACSSATPNSVVYIAGGTYHENLQMNVSGTQGGIILFRNYQDDEVIIDGTGTTGSKLLQIINKSHLAFQNLTFQNLLAVDAKGIEVHTTNNGSCNNLVFKNITIRNIRWTDDPEAIPTAENNAHGMTVTGRLNGVSNVVIDGVKVYNNILGFSEGIQINGNVDGFTISNCEVHDNTNIGIVVAGNYGSCPDPELDHPRNGIVSGNICYRNVSPYAQSAGIYIDGAHDILVEKNISYENQLGIEIGCEENGTTEYIKVRNNVVYNNIKSGIFVGGYTELTTGEVLYCTIRNNTFFQNNSSMGGSGEVTIAKATGCVFEDNLFYTNETSRLLTLYDIEPQTDNLINYNLWYTPSGDPNDIRVYWGDATFHTFEEYVDATGMESNSLFGNPGLDNPSLPDPELEPTNNSLCVDSGNPDLDVDPQETDFEGNPRIINGVVDIGAIEYNQTLGIEPLNVLPRPVVYPNPFTDFATIHVPDEFVDAEVTIFDLTGRIVYEADIEGNDHVISDFDQGAYLYSIVAQNGRTVTGKIISE